jgi:DNA-binding response OmpR family regulator
MMLGTLPSSVTDSIEPKPTATSKLVAVINDDEAFLDLMRAVLEDEGYRCVTRVNAERAAAFVKELGPDLVILDIVFGREPKGWQVLDLLVLNPVTRTIPILLCSAASPGLAERGEQLARLGIDWLPKPFELDDLLTRVEALLRAGPRRGT